MKKNQNNYINRTTFKGKLQCQIGRLLVKEKGYKKD